MSDAERYAKELSSKDLLASETRVGERGRGGIMRTYQIDGGGTYQVLISDPELQVI